MDDLDSLNVWWGDQLVGYLWRNQQGIIGFRYDGNWLAQKKFSISLKLPLREEEYSAEEGGIAHRFFANLLPEGNVRAQIVRDLKISDTDFDLLRAIGGECAGALSLLPVELSPSKDNAYTKLDDDRLIQLIRRRGQIPITRNQNDKRPRLSLAGAQNKCPILLKEEDYYLPDREAPTSHILKFEIPDYKNISLYETYTTLLASSIGLPVVDIELCQRGKDYFTLIKRYDRYEKENNIVRLHQEDFCQSLGYSFNNKYENDQGPSFADCYRLVRDSSSEPVTDTDNLLRWLIFNYIVGNSDNHAKNLAFLYNENGDIRQAPFYDLVCTRAIEQTNAELAFSIGGNYDPGRITKKNWIDLANDCGIAPRYLLSLLSQLAEQIKAANVEAKKKFKSKYGNFPALQRIDLVIAKQHRLITTTL